MVILYSRLGAGRRRAQRVLYPLVVDPGPLVNVGGEGMGGEAVAGPVIDETYVTSEEEDEYDRRCLDVALAEGGDRVSFDAALSALGLTRDDLLI
jgi:hypothetical protein